ncbi:MAG: hypothetical protein MRJ65_00095 [Candidatus Brocadiaceae bacterium]|nr:hypothetical protein [Candidatus Brocadiaceae bacterium]
MRSWHVQIPGSKGRIVKGRVCIIRKTKAAIQVAQNKLRRKARKKGRLLKPETLEYVKYVIVFTTSQEEGIYPGKTTNLKVIGVNSIGS